MKSLNNVIIFFAILAVFGGGLFFFPGSPYYYKNIIFVTQEAPVEEDVDMQDKDTADAQAPDAIEENTPEQTAEENNDVVEEAEQTKQNLTEITLSDRVLGSEDAPVTLYEYSSLSCGHCGSFHEETYPQFKKDYIETGKVRLVMIDFPLNLPALQGAKLAHCLPEDQYFNFLQLLFTTQRSWLTGDYLANLKQNAQLAGLSPDEIEACLANEELEEQILARMENAQAKYEISSTPSFVINEGEEIIVGNQPYNKFISTVNQAYNAASADVETTEDEEAAEE